MLAVASYGVFTYVTCHQNVGMRCVADTTKQWYMISCSGPSQRCTQRYHSNAYVQLIVQWKNMRPQDKTQDSSKSLCVCV